MSVRELQAQVRAEGCCGELQCDFVHVCLKRAGHEGVHGGSDESAERDRAIMVNARSFERELLVAKLEAELFIEEQGDDIEQAYRRGWNARARACIAELRGRS